MATAMPRPGLRPVSYLQAFMTDYYGTLRNPAALHIWMSKRLTDSLDYDLLAAAVRALQERHAILGARFVRRGGSEVYMDAINAAPPAVSCRDFSGVTDAEDLENAVNEFVGDLISTRFDLDRGPLFRLGLSRLGPTDHVLTVVMHHAIGDARSLAVLFRDLLSLYAAKAEGSEPRLPVLTTDFFEEVERQRAWVEGKPGQSRLRFWQQLLHDSRDVFWLPAAHPDRADRAAVSTEFRIGNAELQRIRRNCLKRNCTVSTVLYTAMALSLARWTGRPIVHMKVIHAGRFAPAVQELIGCFISAWILKVDLRTASNLEQSLALVNEAYVNCMPHIRYPFAKLRDFLRERSSDGSVLDITVNHVTAGQTHAEADRDASKPVACLTMEDYQAGPRINRSLDALTGMKLRVIFFESDTELTCMASCAEDVLDKVSVGHFCQDMRRNLEKAANLTSSNLQATPR